MDSERLEKQYKGEDIISRLPDDVLSHIISRLEAKDAVKTCVLSIRWKNVWTLIYNFFFNWTTDGNEGNRGTLFVNFVELVLRRSRSKSIQNFHIRTYYGFKKSDAARLTELICFAVDRSVCSLTVKFDCGAKGRPMIRLPQSILTCKSLVKLSLGFLDFVLDIPDCTVCFPCLKFLSICISRTNSNSVQKLFCICPTLEELKIKGWHEYGNALTFDINMPTLKKLIIIFWTVYDGDILVHRFVVRASNLEYLGLFSDYLACVVVGETPLINKVILGNDVIVRNEPPVNEAIMRATDFFRGISSTRFLSLGIKYMSELCPLLDGNLPFFPNLIYLDLGVDILTCFALLVQFLNNSPILEVLVLVEGEEGEEGWYNNRFELECVPSCMLLHLKAIHLFSLEIYPEAVIKCLLENSKVLERFSVYTCSSTDEEDLQSSSTDEEDIQSSSMDEQEIQNRILNFPRASPICEIEFADYGCKEKLRSKFNKYR